MIFLIFRRSVSLAQKDIFLSRSRWDSFEIFVLSAIVLYLVSLIFSGVWGFCPDHGIGIARRIFSAGTQTLCLPCRGRKLYRENHRFSPPFEYFRKGRLKKAVTSESAQPYHAYHAIHAIFYPPISSRTLSLRSISTRRDLPPIFFECVFSPPSVLMKPSSARALPSAFVEIVKPSP